MRRRDVHKRAPVVNHVAEFVRPLGGSAGGAPPPPWPTSSARWRGPAGRGSPDDCGDHHRLVLRHRRRSFRNAWPRPRCHTAPWRTVRTAATNPRWASLMTSCTPAAGRPPGYTVAPKPRPELLRLGGPHVTASTSRSPSARTPVAMLYALLSTRSPSRPSRTGRRVTHTDRPGQHLLPEAGHPSLHPGANGRDRGLLEARHA